MTRNPASDLDKDVKRLIALACVEIDGTEKDVSVAIGAGEQYIKNLKNGKGLYTMPLDKVVVLARLAKKEMKFVETA